MLNIFLWVGGLGEGGGEQERMDEQMEGISECVSEMDIEAIER